MMIDNLHAMIDVVKPKTKRDFDVMMHTILQLGPGQIIFNELTGRQIEVPFNEEFYNNIMEFFQEPGISHLKIYSIS